MTSSAWGQRSTATANAAAASPRHAEDKQDYRLHAWQTLGDCSSTQEVTAQLVALSLGEDSNALVTFVAVRKSIDHLLESAGRNELTHQAALH